MPGLARFVYSLMVLSFTGLKTCTHTHTHVTNPRATRIARVEGVMEGRQVEGSLHLDFSRDLRHQGSGFDHVLDLCL